MNKKWWIIGGLIVVGAGVGAYFLFRPSKEERQKKKLAKGNDKDDDENTNSLGETPPKDNVSVEQVKTQSYNARPRTTYPDTPFKNSTEGNKFRQWVNDNHSDYAKSIKLDPSGKYNNAYIRKAYQKYGTEYEKALSEQEKKDAGIVTIEMTKTYQDALKKWNKPSSINQYSMPYFRLKFRPLYKADNCHKVSVPNTSYYGTNNKYEKKGDCEGSIYIFNNAKGKSPKDGEVFWTVWWKGSKIATGYADASLNTIRTTWNTNSARSNMGFSGKINVGNSFGQIIGWEGTNCNMRLAWC